MSQLSSLPALRWAVPAVAVAAVIGGGATVGKLTASAGSDLPPRSAAQLVVDLQSTRLVGLSGTVVQRADLGLPAIPGPGGGQGSSDLTSLVSGKHTLRVWYAGPDQARVALLGTLGESDIIVNKQDLWLWESRQNHAVHRKLPAGGAGADAASRIGSSSLPITPQQAADAALAALDPSTVVSTAGSAKVAGRDAYDLVLAPRDAASLVGQVRLAIDAKEHVPLRVQVYAKGSSDPAFEVAFTQISFSRPDQEQFQFKPPPDAKVDEQPATKAPDAKAPDAKSPARNPWLSPGTTPSGGGQPLTGVGSGWTTVLVGRMSSSAQSDKGDITGQLDLVMRNLPRVSGAWGSGRLLSGKLFSILATDDGRMLVGLVSPDRLYQAAADPAAKGVK